MTKRPPRKVAKAPVEIRLEAPTKTQTTVMAEPAMRKRVPMMTIALVAW